ncbi:UBP-type zinc finger domain-containing protein [Streptomyces sp. NPDC002596]|uniref:UBP-type zinc finger domain-containing protein n=1 Tax=unclassified Streptomyces TaxID=2593676 RepID=UPI002250DA6F|nr:MULTISPECIES: UBP-type zinc finger domain-containing protein [unclassified Streptomyces]MCX4530531.1 UBP-type zinc finger domain-containing protein [Streptomyces sp. NBC_01669]WSA03714.1 UBP-type zinc finger domain-containing protein [Streptomyces sp. NBC_00841]
MAPDQIPGIDLAAAPSGAGCADCLAGDGPGWWMHLRRCAACGHIGCCDSSPSQHGTKHAREAGHPFLASFEPGENWLWNIETEEYYEGLELLPPTSHPVDQPTPGPQDKVPADWERQLH